MRRPLHLDRIVTIRRLQEQVAQSAAQKAALALSQGEQARMEAEDAAIAAEGEWRAFTESPAITPQGLLAFSRQVVESVETTRQAALKVEELSSQKGEASQTWLWAQARTQSAEDIARDARRRMEQARDERRLHEVEEAFRPEDDQ